MFSNKAVLPPEGNWHPFLPSLEFFFKEYAYRSPFSTVCLSFSLNSFHEPCFPIRRSTPECFPSIPPVPSVGYVLLRAISQCRRHTPFRPPQTSFSISLVRLGFSGFRLETFTQRACSYFNSPDLLFPSARCSLPNPFLKSRVCFNPTKSPDR